MKNLTDWSKEIHQNNKDKGFYEGKKNIGEMLCLIHSEISEALEADRKNLHAVNQEELFYVDNMEELEESYFKSEFKASIKDTFEDEIADTMIRCLDLCGFLKIDIQKHIEAKLYFNKLREHKHGKNY